MSKEKNASGAQVCCMDLFAVGDEVIHRASGRKAIVIRGYTRCTNPKHTIALHCVGSRECNRVKVDVYDLSLDFTETVEGVSGYLLAANKELSTKRRRNESRTT